MAPLLRSPPLSASFSPATLACASALLIDWTRAVKPTLPAALRSRPVLATALSMPMLTAIEMPTPVSPDLVSPLASVIVAPSCAALARIAPVIDVVPAPDPMRALVSLWPTETAITGVTAVLPAAPPWAKVVNSLDEAAASVRSSAPLSTTPSPTTALVSVMPMLTTIDAPMPNLPEVGPDWLATARALFSTKSCAVSVTSPASVMATCALLAIKAMASVMPTLMAIDPATPVSTPLTPEAALAPMRLVVSLHSRRWPPPEPTPLRSRSPSGPPSSACAAVL